jgi:hypothetical protein
MTDKEKLIKRLRGLKQNTHLSDEEIERMALHKIEEEELKLSFSSFKEEEIQKGISLYFQYLEQHSFQSLAEKTTLINMICKELRLQQVRNFLKKEAEDKNGAIPGGMINNEMELTTQILQDKEKLGMLKSQQMDSLADAWQELKEKAVAYYNEKGGEIYYKCPYCQEFSRQIMQLEGYTIEKASMFRGTTLYNEEVLNLYHAKVITLAQAAKIMGVHHKYIEIVYNDIYLKDKNDK